MLLALAIFGLVVAACLVWLSFSARRAAKRMRAAVYDAEPPSAPPRYGYNPRMYPTQSARSEPEPASTISFRRPRRDNDDGAESEWFRSRPRYDAEYDPVRIERAPESSSTLERIWETMTESAPSVGSSEPVSGHGGEFGGGGASGSWDSSSSSDSTPDTSPCDTSSDTSSSSDGGGCGSTDP